MSLDYQWLLKEQTTTLFRINGNRRNRASLTRSIYLIYMRFCFEIKTIQNIEENLQIMTHRNNYKLSFLCDILSNLLDILTNLTHQKFYRNIAKAIARTQCHSDNKKARLNFSWRQINQVYILQNRMYRSYINYVFKYYSIQYLWANRCVCDLYAT